MVEFSFSPFPEKFGLTSTLSFKHFEFETKLLLLQFGFAATLSFIIFELETKLLLVEFDFAARLYFRNLVSCEDFDSCILNLKQSFSW